MKATINLGVVGLGFMGSRWVRALAEQSGVRVDVVSDVLEDRGHEFADRYQADYVSDPLEAVARPGLDGVVICTPENAHEECALAAIDADKTVLIEKPLAHSVGAAERIRDRARTRDANVLVGHILRFEPRYAVVAQAIRAGEIGEVQAIRGERIGVRSDQEVLRGRTTIPLYYGVHEFDLVRWYGGDVERVFAERSRGVLQTGGYDVEDLYSAVFRCGDGVHGTSMVGWSLPDRVPGFGIGGITVIGADGTLRVVQGETGFLEVDGCGVTQADVHFAPDVHGRLWGALAIEASHFVECVRGIREPMCTATDGAEAVRASLAMEQSALSGTPVSLVDSMSSSERPVV